MDSAIVAWSLGLIYFARPNFGSRGPLVRLGYVTVVKTERGWENAQLGLERYPVPLHLCPIL